MATKVTMRMEPGISWIPPSEMERRINTIPLPKKVKSTFTSTVMRWQRHSGTEWTVVRLKSFKDCLLNSYAEGGRKVAHKPEWFATTPSGRLTGVFGTLWGIAMKGAADLKAVLNIVNIYTGASRTELNQEIMEEITNSITRFGVSLPKRSHREDVPAYNWATKALHRLGWWKGLRYQNKPIPLTWQLPGKESHVARVPVDLHEYKAFMPTSTHEARNLCQEAAGSWLGGVHTNPWQALQYAQMVGDIHVTHEPGLKTRYFASPNLVFQRALTPLKEALLRFLRGVPWDCTLQQRRADKRILTALEHRRVVHSVDLSKATDHFPWKWQFAVLNGLLRGREARAALSLFSSLVELGAWNMPDGSPGYFNSGQPLGLGPSFPLFTLSHGILLYALNGYKWNEDFYVLGDDVVIFDDLLHSRYRKVLQQWKVEVSEAKSFSSANIAQFAGVTYTPTGSFWIPKWRPFTRSSLLDLAAWWYPGLTKGLPEHSLIERVLSLPSPYGIGRNPKGLPLEERLSQPLVDELILREKRLEEKAKPSSTRPDIISLIDFLRKKGKEETDLFQVYLELAEGISLAKRTLEHNIKHGSTKPSLRPAVAMLAHETELGGYPRLNVFSGRVDPYTLGSLHNWKQLFRRVDTAKHPE